MRVGLWTNETLIHKLVHVTIEPTLGWEHCIVQMATFVIALAGLHKHYSPLEALSIGAGEEHRCCPHAPG